MKINRYIAAVLMAAVAISSTSLTFAASTVNQIKNELTFSKLSNESINSVTEDLYLPAVMEGTQIIWRSSDPNLIKVEGNKGIVTRPPFGEGYGGVLLTADIVDGNDYAVRNYIVSVWERDIGYKYSSEIKAAADLFRVELMSKQNIMGLTSNLKLPSIPSGMQLTMYTDAPNIMDSNGVITRNIENDHRFNVYFVLSYGYETLKMSFPVTVKAYDTNETAELLEQDKMWIESYMDMYTTSPVTTNLSLPTSAPNGSVITWTSNSAALTSNGVITRGENDTSVSINAQLELDAIKSESKFDIVIRKKASERDNITGNTGTKSYSGGGGGGGGGSIASGSDISTIPSPQRTDAPIATTQPENSESAKNDDGAIFRDIDKTHWAYSAVEALSRKNIISGYEGYFRPEDAITREESVKLIVSALRVPVEGSADYPFYDVKETDWFSPYIATAFANSIINGIGEHEFGTGKYITRQDFAVIIYNAIKSKAELSEKEVENFADNNDISDYAIDAVYALKKLEIINGRDNNRFEPVEHISRAEAAQMLYKVLNLL